MKSLRIFFCFTLFIIVMSNIGKAKAANDQAPASDVYIVYMGAAKASSSGNSREDYAHLLDSLLRRNVVVHKYQHGFSGFAARLSKEEADLIAQKPGVVSVFPDPILKLHTTRSWQFLKYQTSSAASNSNSNSNFTNGSDTIIGIIDTGIWPESESFSDEGLGPIPSWWKGTCVTAKDFNSSNCNRKLIGARYYVPDYPTPRDSDGHGTHVSATAAGAPVGGASYYGVAKGTAEGGSPTSRIAMYNACLNGCAGSAIMAAFDDAIHDGVDILSISLGARKGRVPKLFHDPIAIGAYHAAENGITVVCAAGNDGPDSSTVVNDAPWVITVAATTIDRDLESAVLLGDNKLIKGGAINFANIQKSPVYPMIYGGSAKKASNDISEEEARNCMAGSLDGGKIKGKIVVCSNDKNKEYLFAKQQEIKKLGGIGFILIDDDFRVDFQDFQEDPATVITSKDAAEIFSYINSTRNPTATILATITVTNYKPAPVLIYYSARGPSNKTKNILKPDIAAPGVSILAAWRENDPLTVLPGRDVPKFYVISGTSMACPHVAGIVATIKSQNPTWTPSMIRSAIMTTGIPTNNLRAPITTSSGLLATPYDYGAGEVSTSKAAQPGLVYENDNIDYLFFLCNLGYNLSTIKLIATDIPYGFSCPENSGEDLISNMNYPSIAITGLRGRKTVTRTVTNVGGVETVYGATVDAPDGVDVKVVPDKLQFTTDKIKQSYQITFTPVGSTSMGDAFGSITWSNGNYEVRSPFVVSGN